MENVARKSEIPWMEGEFFIHSTPLPNIIEESNGIGTVVIFVISALLTIALLFAVAVFIDCRQEKLERLKVRKPKKKLRLKMPRLGRIVRDDERQFGGDITNPAVPTSEIV